MRHLESREQQRVAYWLRAAGIFFCAIPNGGKRNRAEAARMKTEGVTAGAPDIVIFDAPPNKRGFVGVALEMKAPKGRISDEQTTFLERLGAAGWWVIVGYGADDAFRKLSVLGYQGLPVPHEVLS